MTKLYNFEYEVQALGFSEQNDMSFVFLQFVQCRRKPLKIASIRFFTIAELIALKDGVAMKVSFVMPI